MTRLVEEIAADADEAIARAYAEGYKAATLELLPELEAERALSLRLQDECLELEKGRGRGLWAAGLAGAGAGAALAAVVCSLVFGMVN